jgi:hypothetical protein
MFFREMVPVRMRLGPGYLSEEGYQVEQFAIAQF